MSQRARPKAITIGSSSFDPGQFLDRWQASDVPQDNNLGDSIRTSFGLKPTDDYVYHAVASVTLAQVQVAIHHGDANGMHAWYRDESGQQVAQRIALTR